MFATNENYFCSKTKTQTVSLPFGNGGKILLPLRSAVECRLFFTFLLEMALSTRAVEIG